MTACVAKSLLRSENPAVVDPCPGGVGHEPFVAHIGGYFWVECPQCGRESYAVDSAAVATEAWSRDVGQEGRSQLILNLKASAAAAQ